MQLKITQQTENVINIELPLYLRVVKDYIQTYTAILSENEVHEYNVYRDGSMFYRKPGVKESIPQKYDEISREEFMVFADKAISNAYDAYELLFDQTKND